MSLPLLLGSYISGIPPTLVEITGTPHARDSTIVLGKLSSLDIFRNRSQQLIISDISVSFERNPRLLCSIPSISKSPSPMETRVIFVSREFSFNAWENWQRASWRNLNPFLSSSQEKQPIKIEIFFSGIPNFSRMKVFLWQEEGLNVSKSTLLRITETSCKFLLKTLDEINLSLSQLLGLTK